MSHKPHPLAEEFPLLEGAELQEFIDGIRHNGLIHPIVLYQNMILDGRNRETACEIAGVEPRYITLEEIRQGKDPDPIGYVIAANLHRRHLEAGARAMIAAKLATATVGGDHSTNSTNGVPVAQVAKQMNVGTTSVTTASAILKADPKVAADVKTDKISLNVPTQRQIPTPPRLIGFIQCCATQTKTCARSSLTFAKSGRRIMVLSVLARDGWKKLSYS